MSYSIANVIVGTYLTDEAVAAVEAARWNEDNPDDPVAADGSDGELGTIREILREHPWTDLYHGSADNVAYVGEELCVFDETENQMWDALAREVQDAVRDASKLAAAQEKYQSLPQEVRDALPRFGVHVVWSTS